MPQNDSATLKTSLHEMVKRHLVYDGTNRITDVYEARANAEDGEKCMRTQYTYTDPSSALVENILESEDEWDSSWDI